MTKENINDFLIIRIKESIKEQFVKLVADEESTQTNELTRLIETYIQLKKIELNKKIK